MAVSSLSIQSIVNNDAFRETLLDFAKTRALLAPQEPSLEWDAWNAAFAEAFRAVIASVDHYCAVRVLEALLVAQVKHESPMNRESREA
jgi:hypothetical protein